jgi:hypothetical protein
MVRLVALAALLVWAAPAAARPVEVSTVDALAGDWSRFAELEALGPEILPILVDLYEKSPYPARRRALAQVFYRLSWPSAEAKRVLLADLESSDRELRAAVQAALGRVSGDADVVDRLLAILRDDPNPWFRDKAAAALAQDQAHLAAAEERRLYEGLIAALEDEKPQVRSLAIRTLRLRTGQTQGFAALGRPAERSASVQAWHLWLEATQPPAVQLSDAR